MSLSRTTRLSDLTGPVRSKPRYAPLTAGLLARKGEAEPATSFFTTTDMAHGAGARMALPVHQDDDHFAEWEDSRPLWRARRILEEEHEAVLGAEEHARSHAHEPEVPHAHAAHVHVEAQARPHHEGGTAAFEFALDLGVLARLMLEARRSGAAPARVVEMALAAYLPGLEAPCPLCDSPHAAR